MQFENEFGGIKNANDLEYFQFLKNTITKTGFHELLFNCDYTAIDVWKIIKQCLVSDNYDQTYTTWRDKFKKGYYLYKIYNLIGTLTTFQFEP